VPPVAAVERFGVRSFVGVPIVLPDGHVAGTLCAMDRQTAEITPDSVELMTVLSRLVAHEIWREQLHADSEAALAARHGAIFAVVPDAIVVMDDAGRIVEANPAAKALFGYARGALAGKDGAILMPERFRDAHREALRRLREGGEPRHIGTTLDLVGLRSDGEEFPIELSLGAWEDHGERRFVGVVRDLTERKRAEDAQRQAVRSAEEADRLKSEFLSTISHELRTPMQSVLGYAELLLMGASGPLSAEQDADVRQIVRGGEQMMGLVDGILDLTRIEQGKIVPAVAEVDLRAVAEEVVRAALPAAQRLGLALELADGPPAPAWTDGRLVRQVLANLVGNAIKFTERGGITVRLERAGDRWRCSVTDTGIGIPAHLHEAIFEPFRQVDGSTTRRHSGIGLGLSISRRLVESLGGTIAVESAPGEGATFRLELPADSG